MIKTRRFGYDGKGQAIIRDGDDLEQVWEDLGTKSAILEAFVPFEREISVIAARSADGHVECFDVTENEHRDHILKISRAPADIPDALAAEARGIAEKIANALDYVGVLAVEMFVVPGRRRTDGAGQRDRAAGAQFRPLDARRRVDLAVRAAHPRHCRLAARQAGPPRPRSTMTNLIGDDINDYEQWLTVPGATVHLYGKGPPRPGRKMGHVTQVLPRDRHSRRRTMAGLRPSTTPAGSSLSQR